MNRLIIFIALQGITGISREFFMFRRLPVGPLTRQRDPRTKSGPNGI
jgi:hypothetical protein